MTTRKGRPRKYPDHYPSGGPLLQMRVAPEVYEYIKGHGNPRAFLERLVRASMAGAEVEEAVEVKPSATPTVLIFPQMPADYIDPSAYDFPLAKEPAPPMAPNTLLGSVNWVAWQRGEPIKRNPRDKEPDEPEDADFIYVCRVCREQSFNGAVICWCCEVPLNPVVEYEEE